MCIAGKSLQYSYCDYWLYGGVQDPSAELLKKSKKYQEQRLFNLTSTPKTLKSLKFEKDHIAELNKAKAVGTVPENQKRSDCLGRNAERKIGLSPTTNVVRTSNGRRFDETTSIVRMVDVRGNDKMLHSVKTKGGVAIIGVRKTDDAPITTEGCAATKNKRSH
jgi:hypothetical protein